MSADNTKNARNDEAAAIRHREFILDWFERAVKQRELQTEFQKKELEFGTTEQLSRATWALGIFQVMMIILYATVGGVQEIPNDGSYPGSPLQGYNMFIGVEIMMFIGFGYLMTFMKWYGLGAVGFTMVVTAIGLQWAVFTESFFGQLTNNLENWHNVDLNIYNLLNALYAVSAVLITLGAVIGKVSPFQLVVLTILELGLHSFNYKVLMQNVMNVADCGGTYSDHMFGAYFGLACAYVLGRPKSLPEFGNTPDIFSLIGTLFLWIYWPSFVVGAAPAESDQQARGLVNTILALAASTVVTFLASSYFSSNKKYRPVDIQNATLAGGVAIGCTANLTMSCFGAIMIGCAAGLWSTFGYNVIQPYLEEKWGLHDTCGVHNLHAMPSVIGALASVFLAAHKGGFGRTHDAALYGSTHYDQWWRQLLGILLCAGFAVIAGATVGFLLKALDSATNEHPIPEFHDNQYWAVAEDYGRSLYTELGLVVKSVESSTPALAGHREGDKTAVDVDKAILDWSSHSGRRRPGSNHGGADGLSLSGHSWHGRFQPIPAAVKEEDPAVKAKAALEELSKV